MSSIRSPLKLLVANRSEIACRIFQTCREMGLKTVALLAPGDEQARHITYADEVQEVSSYMDSASILEAANRSKASLIHPGYGFLSERAHFAREVEKAGYIFIGPTAQSIEHVAEKKAAKRLAVKLGIPTIPWAEVKKGESLIRAARSIGYPVLLKACSGGGGKGMRRVDQEDQLFSFALAASSEASSSCGDETLFLERYIECSRHIEIQVFGDGLGGGVHLYERECSLQRRHQKIWEEAPAPFLSEEIKEGLFHASLKFLKAIHYKNAGTLEFLIDQQGHFFFLEMNPRLQVEHAVTEAITGVDLVWAQIMQAQKEGPILHETPSSRGHAIEVRLYAEDPDHGFTPAPGSIDVLKWPLGAGIRIESGIEEGQEIGVDFDAMLGKIIVSAPTREHALSRLRYALEETVLLGLKTNQASLRALVEHPDVQAGRVHTEFFEKQLHCLSDSQNRDFLNMFYAKQRKDFFSSQALASLGPLNQESAWIFFENLKNI